MSTLRGEIVFSVSKASPIEKYKIIIIILINVDNNFVWFALTMFNLCFPRASRM